MMPTGHIGEGNHTSFAKGMISNDDNERIHHIFNPTNFYEVLITRDLRKTGPQNVRQGQQTPTLNDGRNSDHGEAVT